MQHVLHHPHTLGADEARRRVCAALERIEGTNKNIQSTGFGYDGASKTFTLHLKAYGRDASVAFQFGDNDVQVTVDDDAGWFVEHFIVEPKVQALLTEALK